MRRFAAAFLLALGSTASASAVEPFSCLLMEAGGASEAEARTAAGLICDDLRRESGARGAFEIRLGVLGSVVNVTATRLDTGESISVQAGGLEEIPLASARIAEALVRHQRFAATQRVDNLLQEETREARAKRGSVKFTLGVADLESIGHGARGAGFSLGLMYASPRFALPAEMRFAWDDTEYGEPGISLFSASLGGRGYLSKRDVSPFVGGGLGLLRLEASEGEYPYPGSPSSGYFQAEWFGLAPYVEAGVEVLRLHRGRIALHVRADFPLAALQSEEVEVWSEWDPAGRAPRVERVYPAQSRYVVPVSIGLSVAF
jgi:hypothetical protein